MQNLRQRIDVSKDKSLEPNPEKLLNANKVQTSRIYRPTSAVIFHPKNMRERIECIRG